MINFHDYYSQDIYLAHHGIKGQKWGVRRFQNPDGTLTEAGKLRYNETLGNAKRYAEECAKLERSAREYNKLLKDHPNADILEIKDTEDSFIEGYSRLAKLEKELSKKYGEISGDVVTMDDGYDYVRTLVFDKKLDGYVVYMESVGKAIEGGAAHE